jgi:hypothetical protein
LTKLHNLRGLDLSYTKVTDAGLKELASLKQLRWLELRHTAVTDAGLKELKGLVRLEHVYLGTDMRTTAAGTRELEKAIPGLRVWVWDPR